MLDRDLANFPGGLEEPGGLREPGGLEEPGGLKEPGGLEFFFFGSCPVRVDEPRN